MTAQELKDYIIENDLVPVILESLGCHHIKKHEDYYSCCNPNGDNRNAVNVYSSTLAVVNYTRNLDKVSQYHDIFTLVQFYKECDFFDAFKYVCSSVGLSIYYDVTSELPESLALTKELLRLIEEDEPREVEKPLKPIPEGIIYYYLPYVNDMFKNDHISYDVQSMFDIRYDPCSNRITIPIRNYDGCLVGVKGRWFGDIPEESDIQKYIYLEPCNKGQVLYGLYESLDYIKQCRYVYVGESEKFVLQLWTYGDRNCVSTGGKTMSAHQIELLSRLCDRVILCLDQDVGEEELKHLADKFLGAVEVYTIVDEDCLLVEKESPSDDPDKWSVLKECLKRIR